MVNFMLAKTPPMGWNSWNTFGNDISESLLKETADAFIDQGLKEAGYEYVVIDDCWSKMARENGRLVPIICKYTDKNTKTKEWRKWTLAVVAVRFLENCLLYTSFCKEDRRAHCGALQRTPCDHRLADRQ